jgi:hypothetical protein
LNVTAQTNGHVGTDKKGIIIPSDYWRGKVYTDGFAIVEDTTTNLYGFASRFGVEIPCIYTSASDFSEELAAVQDAQTGKYGYINKKGETVIPFLYDEVGRFGHDRDGHQAFDGLAYVNIGMTSEGRYKIFSDGKWGLINKKGEVVLPIKYGYISPSSEGIAFIYDGEIFIDKQTFDKKSVFSGNLGFINASGTIIIKPQFDFHASMFHNGVAEVKKDGKTFYINTKGKKVKVKNK